MPKIVFKETVTKEREIEISIDALRAVIDKLTLEEKKELLDKLSVSIKKKKPLELVTFKKDTVEHILADFRETDLYEEDFLRDLEEGLKKSSPYR